MTDRTKRKTVRPIFVFFGLAILILFTQAAEASRPARINVDQATVVDSPQSKSITLETLPNGTSLVVSNLPTQGYYKVRTASGIVGWIASEQLQLFESNDEDPLLSPAAPRAAVDRSGPRKVILIRGLGGVGLFSLSDIKTQLQFTGMQFGLNYGGELGFWASSDVALLLRAEWMQKSTLAVDAETQNTYQLLYSSLPIMMGLEFKLVRGKYFGLSIGVLGGIGIDTQFNATALNLSAPNKTTVSGIAFTGLAKLNIEYLLTSWLQIFTEFGYRALGTAQLMPTTSANGDEILRDEATYVPVSVDFSGPVVSGGITLAF